MAFSFIRRPLVTRLSDRLMGPVLQTFLSVNRGLTSLRLRRTGHRHANEHRVLFFAHLAQDIAIIAPHVAEAAGRAGVDIEIWITAGLLQTEPAARERLANPGVTTRIVSHTAVLAGFIFGLARFDSLVTASESSSAGHPVSHALTRLANAWGVATYTMQHGFENAGLSYFEDVHDGDILFASTTVFTWNDPALLPQEVPDETRRKCVAVGRAVPPPSLPPPGAQRDPRPAVFIFENLHWDRYSETYGRRFFEDLRDVAAARPEFRFVLRPHPAVLRRKMEHEVMLAALESVEVAGRDHSIWGGSTAADLLAVAEAAITTPSTTALDAAFAQIPVAVARYDLQLDLYEPLPLLEGGADWLSFLDTVRQDRSRLVERDREFIDRSCLPGNAAARAIDWILRP